MNENKTTTLNRRFIWAIFSLALAVRVSLLALGPWQDFGRAIRPDSSRYLVLAENLGRYGSFGLVEEESAPAWRRIAELRESNGTRPPRNQDGLRPESFRVPGYPLFVLAIRAVFSDPRSVLVVQCVLGSLTAVLVTLLATSLQVPRAGTLASGLLWAIHPAVVAYDCILLTESLFCFCTALSLMVAARAGGVTGGLSAGALIGFAGLVRPLVGLLYIPAALALLVPHSRRRALAAVCLIGASLAPSMAWALRNRTSGEGLRVSSMSDLTLLYYAAGYSISEERGEDWTETWPTRVEELADGLGRAVKPGDDVYSAARRLAIGELKSRPASVCRVVSKSQFKLLTDHSLGDLYQLLGKPYRPAGLRAWILSGRPAGGDDLDVGAAALAVAWFLANVVIAFAALAGLFLALRDRRMTLLIACGLPCLLVAGVTSSNGLERFRLAMAVPLFILAGFALAAVMHAGPGGRRTTGEGQVPGRG